MEQSLKKAFKMINEKNPPSYLKEAILVAVRKERSKQIKRKVFLSYGSISFSILATIYAGLMAGEAILNSEFWNLSLLFFSDIAVIYQYWQDFAFSLLETFPFTHFMLILIPIFFLFLSLNFFFSIKKNNQQIFSH